MSMDQKQLLEELKSADTYPTGPVSAWPSDRNEQIMRRLQRANKGLPEQPEMKASAGQMATGLVKNAAMALKGGRVSKEIRDRRYETCKTCPAFNSESKRCTECGCFMQAKSWLNAPADVLCPLKKWEK